MAKRTLLSATSTETFTYVILGSCVFFLAFGVFLILAFANCLPGAVHVNWEWRPQMLGFAPSPVIFSPTNYYKDINIFLLILFCYEILISPFERNILPSKLIHISIFPYIVPTPTNYKDIYIFFLKLMSCRQESMCTYINQIRRLLIISKS